MINIHPTASLAKKLKVALSPDTILADNKLGAWYCNDFILNRKQFILFTSESSRLPIVIFAAPYTEAISNFITMLHQVLQMIDIDENAIDEELNHYRDAKFYKTSNKSILGTMVDSIKMLEHMAYIDPAKFSDPLQISLYLAEVPSLVMKATYPREAALLCLHSGTAH